MSVSALQGTFTTVGEFTQMQAERGVNVSLDFGAGSVVHERSFDQTKWWNVATYFDDVTLFWDEPEAGVYHRLRVAEIATPIHFRLSN